MIPTIQYVLGQALRYRQYYPKKCPLLPPAPTVPQTPAPAPEAGQPPRLLPRLCPRRPPFRRPPRGSHHLRLLPRRPPKRLCRRQPPNGRRRKPKPTKRPRASRNWSGHGPIPWRIAKIFQRSGKGWAYRQPVDKFAQAAIVESPQRTLLPSATCQIERASEVEGALKVSAECADSIGFTPRRALSRERNAHPVVG